MTKGEPPNCCSSVGIGTNNLAYDNRNRINNLEDEIKLLKNEITKLKNLILN